MDFRTEMQKLEKIVNDMKDENIDINEVLKLYDEGIKSYEFCKKVLEEAEQKIEVLNEKGETECPDKNTTDLKQ